MYANFFVMQGKWLFQDISRPVYGLKFSFIATRKRSR